MTNSPDDTKRDKKLEIRTPFIILPGRAVDEPEILSPVYGKSKHLKI
jgi:hypothetical protein